MLQQSGEENLNPIVCMDVNATHFLRRDLSFAKVAHCPEKTFYEKKPNRFFKRLRWAMRFGRSPFFVGAFSMHLKL